MQLKGTTYSIRESVPADQGQERGLGTIKVLYLHIFSPSLFSRKPLSYPPLTMFPAGPEGHPRNLSRVNTGGRGGKGKRRMDVGNRMQSLKTCVVGLVSLGRERT